MDSCATPDDGRLSRRRALGAAAGVAGIVALPLPASAEAFSGPYPPAPSSTEEYPVYTGGGLSLYTASDGGGIFFTPYWSTAVTNQTGNSGYNNRTNGDPVTFNFTVQFMGGLFAYGTIKGESKPGVLWSGQSVGVVAASRPFVAPASGSPWYTVYYPGPSWNNTNRLSLYVVSNAGVRWKVENWSPYQLPTFVSY